MPVPECALLVGTIGKSLSFKHRRFDVLYNRRIFVDKICDCCTINILRLYLFFIKYDLYFTI